MSAPIRVVGSHLSPFVRKVLACLDLKGLAYQIDPIPPSLGDDRFTQLSPLRRVPVLIDGRAALADSSVIAQYLEDPYPQPALFPADVADRDRARWFEEYADTRIAEVLVWGILRRAVLEPGIFGMQRDVGGIERIVRDELPGVLDCLDSCLPRAGFLFDVPGIADRSLAVDRVLGLPCLTKLRPYQERLMRTPVAKQRVALAALGAPLTADTIGGDAPRPGAMRS